MTGTGVTRRGLSGQVRGAIRGSGGGSSRSCALQFLRGIMLSFEVIDGGPGAALRRNRIEARPARGRRDAPGEAQRPGSLGLCLAVCGCALALCGSGPGLFDAGFDGIGDGAAWNLDHNVRCA